jgi:hypothetical protein
MDERPCEKNNNRVVYHAEGVGLRELVGDSALDWLELCA